MKKISLISLRSDHGCEFENHGFETFWVEHGYNHNFSAPRTPQQNGVVKRKIWTLKEMARTALWKQFTKILLGRSYKHFMLCH